jgi:hypothetical protein
MAKLAHYGVESNEVMCRRIVTQASKKGFIYHKDRTSAQVTKCYS